MSAASDALVLASGVQGGGAHPLHAHDSLMVVVLIVVLAAICVPICVYLRRRYRQPKPVANEWQAQAVMGELCSHGWKAHITLYGWGAPIPDDAPPSRTPLVQLEWEQFDEEPGHVVAARRVWAPSIAEALQAMADDRRTDITLEQIEQSLAEQEDGAWGD